MARRGAERAVPDALPSIDRREPLLKAEISIVTPMFGGGATPGEVDVHQPVNGKEIRGQLRFWWRACRAHRFTSADDLFEEEARIWGKSAEKNKREGPSQIEIDVSELKTGTNGFLGGENDRNAWQSHRSREYPAYALFPFQYQRQTKRPARSAQFDVSFALRLFAAPDPARPAEELIALKKEVEAALWAWITFGGIGARSRRGCGALSSPQCRPDKLEPLRWLREKIEIHAPGDSVPDHVRVPVLKGSEIILNMPSPVLSPVGAWLTAIDSMREFRQGGGTGRTSARGESLWPEADSIRNLTGKSIARHEPADLERRYFPRAEFGLPIVFHFKRDDPPDPGHTDPSDHALEVGRPGESRMASPFVLKPLALTEGAAVPMVSLLTTPRLVDIDEPSVQLRNMDNQDVEPYSLVPDRDIYSIDRAWATRPLHESDAANPREAFLNFVESSWGSTAKRGRLG